MIRCEVVEIRNSADAIGFPCSRTAGTQCFDWVVFEARNGSPLNSGNVCKRVLRPLLRKLGIPEKGRIQHAFRHSRVTMLRKNGTPSDLQKQWIRHSSLRTTDRYSHTHEELEYRRLEASKVGLNFDVGPNRPKPEVGNFLATA